MRKTLVALGMVMLLLTAFSKYASASSLPACDDKEVLETVKDLMFKYIMIPELNESFWKHGIKFYLTYQNFSKFMKKIAKYMKEYRKNPNSLNSLDPRAKKIFFASLPVFRKYRPYLFFEENYYIPVARTLFGSFGTNKNSEICDAKLIVLRVNDQFKVMYSVYRKDDKKDSPVIIHLLRVIKLNNSQEQ